MNGFLSGLYNFPFSPLESFYLSFKTLLKCHFLREMFSNPQNLSTGVHRAFLPEHILQDLSIHSGCFWICVCSMWRGHHHLICALESSHLWQNEGCIGDEKAPEAEKQVRIQVIQWKDDSSVT